MTRQKTTKETSDLPSAISEILERELTPKEVEAEEAALEHGVNKFWTSAMKPSSAFKGIKDSTYIKMECLKICMDSFRQKYPPQVWEGLSFDEQQMNLDTLYKNTQMLITRFQTLQLDE